MYPIPNGGTGVGNDLCKKNSSMCNIWLVQWRLWLYPYNAGFLNWPSDRDTSPRGYTLYESIKTMLQQKKKIHEKVSKLEAMLEAKPMECAKTSHATPLIMQTLHQQLTPFYHWWHSGSCIEATLRLLSCNSDACDFISNFMITIVIKVQW